MENTNLKRETLWQVASIHRSSRLSPATSSGGHSPTTVDQSNQTYHFSQPLWAPLSPLLSLLLCINMSSSSSSFPQSLILRILSPPPTSISSQNNHSIHTTHINILFSHTFQGNTNNINISKLSCLVLFFFIYFLSFFGFILIFAC